MTTFTGKDAGGQTIYIDAQGAGTSGDPHQQIVDTNRTRFGGQVLNALEIRSTASVYYTITAQTTLTTDDMLKFNYFMFEIDNTHDQALDFEIQALGPSGVSNNLFTLYSADDVIAASGKMIFIPFAGGTGVGLWVTTVAALQGVYYDLRIQLRGNPAPTSGNVSVWIAAN